MRRSICMLSVALVACGSDPPSSPTDAPSPIDVPSPIDASSERLELALIAGDIGGPGNLDGTGAAARFHNPAGVAVDPAGNVYVTDQRSHTLRKVTAAGVVTTMAGSAGVSGSADGTGAAARFYYPADVTIDSAGNVYVADFGDHIIRKVTPAGAVTTLAGAPGVSGSSDGPGAAARFYEPRDVAVDSAGNVYVADTRNHTVRKITPAGIVTTLAGMGGVSGSTDGPGAAARFNQPSGVAVDSAGNIYVTDTGNSTLRKVTAAGTVATVAGTAGLPGSTDGTGAAARFYGPRGVAVDSTGSVYVTDVSNSNLRKVTAAGVVTTLAGMAGQCGSTDGTGPAARFCSPWGVGVDGAGNVYVADYDNHALRKVTAAGVVTTLAGASGAGNAEGTGPAARFSGGLGVAADSTGTLYVADQRNHAIRKVTPDGVVTTLAGMPGVPGKNDGTGAAARFGWPISVAIDSAGNLYVADFAYSNIRKITPAGVVTTLAGAAGEQGSADGVGAAARFCNPTGVAVDRAGHVYVADPYNHIIRKITPDGVVTTLAGTAGAPGSVDGTGIAARFNFPSSVAVDPAGDVYVSDRLNYTIRKISPERVVTTWAGTAGAPGSTDGTGALARFNGLSGLAIDMAGNVYVVDTSTIRKITATGTTTTIAGTAGKVGIVLGPTPGLAFPGALALVGDSIVIGDTHAVLLLRGGAR